MTVKPVIFNVKRRVLGAFLGKYRSLFRGKGIEYAEIRKYAPGDDPKAFVWSKLAQLGEGYTKTFLEERDVTVIVAVDVSGSVFWNRPQKSQLSLEAAAALIFSAAISNDRVGLILFSDGVEFSIAPGRGLQQAGRLIEVLAKVRPRRQKTLLGKSFRGIRARRGPKRAVIFVLSDFFSDDEGWEAELSSLARYNDVIALTVTDSVENEPVSPGWVYAQDPEAGSSCLFLASEGSAKAHKQRLSEERDALRRRALGQGIGLIELIEGVDPVSKMRKFFEQRARRR